MPQSEHYNIVTVIAKPVPVLRESNLAIAAPGFPQVLSVPCTMQHRSAVILLYLSALVPQSQRRVSAGAAEAAMHGGSEVWLVDVDELSRARTCRLELRCNTLVCNFGVLDNCTRDRMCSRHAMAHLVTSRTHSDH